MRAIVILIMMAGLLCLGACATSDEVSDRKTGQQLVCHKGKTRAVTTGDYFIHTDHGDSIGPCPVEE